MSTSSPLGARVAWAWAFAMILLLLVVTAGEAMLAAVLALVLVGAIAAGPRVEADATTQRLVVLVLTVLTVAVNNAVHEHEPRGVLLPFWVGVAAASVLVASLRLVVLAPDGGPKGHLVVGLLGLTAAGETRIGGLYAAAVVGFLGASLVALRLGDEGRPPLRITSRRAWAVGVGIVVGALGLAVAAALPLRPMGDWLQMRLDSAYVEMLAARGGGFADSMRIGRLKPQLRSDAVALRLRGPAPALVAGVVLDRYEHGYWSRSPDAPKEHEENVGKGPLAEADAVEVKRAGRDDDRLFVPRGAAALGTVQGIVLVGPHGTARTASATLGRVYWFRGDGSTPRLRPPDPGDTDLQIPPGLQAVLETLSGKWIGGDAKADVPRALRRLEEHFLTEFRYDLAGPRGRHADPVVDFLFYDRVGHCEYFASAMALLARSAGIPARVVLGYRVHEKNPLSDYFIVRGRNAHAWVEAWVPGTGWTTWDPTPGTEDGLRDRTSSFSAALDLASVWWDQAEAWLAQRTLLELGLAAALGTGVFVAQRAWRNRKNRGAAQVDAEAGHRGPLPAYAELEGALAARGTVRHPAETLESFAARLDDGPVASLVRRYAALRYGHVTDEPLLDELREQAARLRRLAFPPAAGGEP